MDNKKSFESILYTVNETNFTNIAIDLFRFQSRNNAVYAAYLQQLKINPVEITSVNRIPFLPISFFKTQQVKTGKWQPETTFHSSSTTGLTPSTHEVKDLSFYLNNSKQCFEFFFKPLSEYHFFALLPSYLERSNSSLIAMMDFFIQESKSEYSGFYLSDMQKLISDIRLARKNSSRKIIVWGVSFALLELAENYSPDLNDCLVFETGGMKGRRKELTRQQLHETLRESFNVSTIYSEYGMTELFSQAYTQGGAVFDAPPWMRVVIREVGDPFTVLPQGKPGGINIIDLANIHSIAFLETEDSGIQFENQRFDVLGRLDNTDIRGCNLLVE